MDSVAGGDFLDFVDAVLGDEASALGEGSKRRSTNDLCHFLNIAEGSTEEVKFLLMLAHDLGYLENATQLKLLNLAEAIGAMLNNLIRSLRL